MDLFKEKRAKKYEQKKNETNQEQNKTNNK